MRFVFSLGDLNAWDCSGWWGDSIADLGGAWRTLLERSRDRETAKTSFLPPRINLEDEISSGLSEEKNYAFSFIHFSRERNHITASVRFIISQKCIEIIKWCVSFHFECSCLHVIVIAHCSETMHSWNSRLSPSPLCIIVWTGRNEMKRKTES